MHSFEYPLQLHTRSDEFATAYPDHHEWLDSMGIRYKTECFRYPEFMVARNQLGMTLMSFTLEIDSAEEAAMFALYSNMPCNAGIKACERG